MAKRDLDTQVLLKELRNEMTEQYSKTVDKGKGTKKSDDEASSMVASASREVRSQQLINEDLRK